MTDNKINEIAQQVSGLDLWQPRDWPHRRGDTITLDLLSFPLTQSSSGNRGHPCDQCGQDCQCIHDNVLCWNCKGAFCLFCFMKDPTPLMLMSKDKIVNDGWGDCPVCQTRLRAIALIDVFRIRIDQGTTDSSKMNRSLVQEAEWALAKAEKLAVKIPQKPEKRDEAVRSYTHAINAINYAASASKGSQLILRTKDILLIAHARRAELEDNMDLQEAIIAQFPGQSLRRSKKAPLEDFGHFQACFYTLPAKFMAPAQGGLLCLDTRERPLQAALRQPALLEQVRLAGGEAQFQQWKSIEERSVPTAGGPEYESMGGVRKGVQHFSPLGVFGIPSPCTLQGFDLSISTLFHFLWAFPTKTAASEFFRVRDFSDTCPGSEMAPCKEAKQALLDHFEGKLKHLQVTLNRPSPQLPPQVRCFAVVAVLGHLVTKLYIFAVLGASDSVQEVLVTLGTKVLTHILTIEENASDYEGCRRAHDCSLCSWCGEGAVELRRCSMCGKAYYCTRECQGAHWKMKGPFGHKAMCAQAKDNDESETAMDVGSHVTLHGLKKKELNGKNAVVLSEISDTGRRTVVLMDDLSVQELNRILQTQTDLSWVPDRAKKSIKEENLMLSKTAVMPMINR